MSEQVSTTQKLMLDGVRFSMAMGFTLGWPAETAVRKLYEAAKTSAHLDTEALSEDDGFFLLDCILQALQQMYAHRSESDLIMVMNQFFRVNEA